VRMPANTHAHMHTGCSILLHPVWSLYVEHQPSMFLLCELPWKNLWPLHTTSPLCFCCVSWPTITRSHVRKHTCTQAARFSSTTCGRFMSKSSPLNCCCVSWLGKICLRACKHTHAYRLLAPPPPYVAVVCRAPALYVSAV